jgi:hypothetical protein
VVAGTVDVPVMQALASQRPDAVFPDDDTFDTDPECGTMKYFGEGMLAGMMALQEGLFAVYSAVLPDLGAAYDGSEFAFALSWSFVLPFGPETGPLVRVRWHCAPDEYAHRLRPNRLHLEAGFVFATPTTYFARPGYSWVWHAKGASFGAGLGLGSTLAWSDAAGFRPSLSPELGLRYGECCDPGYWVLTLRYDRYFAGEHRNTALVKLGFDYW